MPLLPNLPLRRSYITSDDPLHAFYIPALSASVRYDRMTGFFSSSALTVAAAGVAHLVASGGTMRLLVGAQLAPDDVKAVRAGHDLREVIAARMEPLPDPKTLTDQLMRDRLAALAWMVAAGALEMRVVLPQGADGLPIAAPESRDYFHPKIGIFTDALGNQVAFSGSINESITGWQHNYEQFMVFYSWSEEGRLYVAETLGRFERLWEQREPDWIALPVPEAAHRSLLRYTPARAPTRDPLTPAPEAIHERVVHMVPAPTFSTLQGEVQVDAAAQERIICQFIRDAPHLIGASGLGAATAAVTPWPHQQAVAHQIVSTYPARYLLADEVGLGKTVEAGLVLRQLWLSGSVRRALILAPKSVLRQWQEELYEKFALEVPIYDGTLFHDPWSRQLLPTSANPWDACGLVLASSQLVKRQDRQQTLLAARPWDLVLVDEAHHARRKDFLNLEVYRANRLLEMLNALQGRTRGLILMTATPMQVHPIEVWDLLHLLGLSGEWGADGRNFLRFYEELRRPLEDADWDFVLRLFRSEVAVQGGQVDPHLASKALESLGPVDWARVCALFEPSTSSAPSTPGRAMTKLPPQARVVALKAIKHHTPLRRLVFRSTRRLLREYVGKGLLKANVPYRDPRLEWIPMRSEERVLYDRIEEYITRFYRKYEQKRVGLGFVMTVYRRRLTSSFYAVQRSLERRLTFLRGAAGPGLDLRADLGLDEDDVEQEALSLDADESEMGERNLFRDEIEYVEDFVRELSALGGCGSKVARLLEDLAEVFRQRETAIVFTQYTDTLDFLREQLRQTYGPQVACYSGRGGERWDGVMWVPVTKEEIKNAFRKGDAIKILLATDAASEGLNLQTCGVLINYDMPWNPMRVEQRIGRVDRIEQRYERVWVRNYFYADTIEAKVYQALSHRIDWFQDVVGPLQPILALVGRTIQTLAMVPEAERQQALKAELERLQAELDQVQAGLDLDEWAAQVAGSESAATPVILTELGTFLTTTPALQSLFRPHETLPGALWLRLDGQEIAVTFDPALFDDHPESLRLLTFGSPLLERVLGNIVTESTVDGTAGPVLRLATESPLPRVAYYTLGTDSQAQRLNRLSDLKTALASPTIPPEWPEAAVTGARQDFQASLSAETETMAEIERQQALARQHALKARAMRFLLDAALIELALGQQPDLFGQNPYPAMFDRAAVSGLKRHGYPWAPLWRIVGAQCPAPTPGDAFFIAIQGETVEQLKRRFESLQQRAGLLLREIAVP